MHCKRTPASPTARTLSCFADIILVRRLCIGSEAKLRQSDEEAIAARAVAADWQRSQEQLNKAKAKETSPVGTAVVHERLQEAHRHVGQVLATAER